MMLTSPFVIELTEAERRGLEQVADSRAAPFGQVQRASVILAVADGMSNAAATQTPPGADTAWTHRLLADPPGRPGVLHQGRRGVRALPDLPGQRGGVQRG